MKKKLAVLMMSVVLVFTLGVSVFAASEGGSMSSITTAVTSAMQSVQSDALSLIASILPYALAILGAVLVVTIGIKVFRRIAGR